MLELTINDMTCGHCVGVVTKAIQKLDPQARVAIDLATHHVSVESSASSLRAWSRSTLCGCGPGRCLSAMTCTCTIALGPRRRGEIRGQSDRLLSP